MSFYRLHPGRRSLGAKSSLPPIGNGYSVNLDNPSGNAEHLLIGSGVTDYQFEYPGGSFTIAGWFKTEGLAGNQVIFAHENTSQVGFRVYLASTGKFATAMIYNLSGNYRGSRTYADVSADKWYFFAATALDDADNWETYLNGSYNVEGTNNGGNPVTSTPTYVTADCKVGGAVYSSGYKDFNGQLHNMTIWNKRLNGVEILEAYNGGVPPDYSLHSAAENLVGWWQPTENDDMTSSTGGVADESERSNDATPVGTESADKVTDTP